MDCQLTNTVILRGLYSALLVSCCERGEGGDSLILRQRGKPALSVSDVETRHSVKVALRKSETDPYVGLFGEDVTGYLSEGGEPPDDLDDYMTRK
jgi:hypothetical protein